MPAGTVFLDHFLHNFCFFPALEMDFPQPFPPIMTAHGELENTPTLTYSYLSLYKYNIKPPYKGVGKCREKLERNRESFQECFEQKNSLKQTLLFKVLKLLKVEKSFRFNSPFIIFGTKTWKIFALKLS
jgi:hypothetical protein